MSFKSIAVPPRATTRKGGVLTKAYAPAASAAGRPLHHSGGHRYAAGDRLMMAPGGREISRGASACVVVGLLPHEGGPLRYRVRSESESFERIVDEADLSSLRPALNKAHFQPKEPDVSLFRRYPIGPPGPAGYLLIIVSV